MNKKRRNGKKSCLRRLTAVKNEPKLINFKSKIFGSSSAIFGKVRKMFGNICTTLGQHFENLRKPSENGRKSSGKSPKTTLLVDFYNKQNITWLLGDMKFISLCSNIDLNTGRQIPYLQATM